VKRGKKEKISTEVLITHVLQITLIKNRRKRIRAEHNKEKLKAIEEEQKEEDKNTEVSRYKRATLGYLPKEFVRRFHKLAKKHGKTETEIEGAITKINKDTIKYNYKLYGE
jgi:hypothetical protein